MFTRFSFFNRQSSLQEPTSSPKNNAEIIQDAQREIIRQARHSFDLYAIGIAASTILGITASGLVLANRLAEAGLTAVTGFGFITYSAQMNKESQEKLRGLLDSFKELSKM